MYMKKIKRVMAVFMSVLILFSSLGKNTFAAETESTSKIKVYDSTGNLIDELDSLDELTKYGINPNTRAQQKLMELFYDVLKGLIVQYLVATIKNAFDYANEQNIKFPTVDPGDTITVYSLDGNIYNPYPPNSYQGTTWRNTNFIVVVSWNKYKYQIVNR